MVKIRLSRTGRKNLASYRLVITPAREKRESSAIEYIGYFLPHEKKTSINAERAKYWLSVGAQPTPTVKSLLIKEGVIEKSKHVKTFTHKPGKKSTERKAKKEAKSEK